MIEKGLVAEQRKQKEFLALLERFRKPKKSKEAKRLGDKIGRMIFGS